MPSAVPSDRTVVSKERAAGSYHLSAYFLAKTCSEDPMNLIPPLFFTAVLFPVAGLSGWGAFFGTILVFVLLLAMSQVSAGCGRSKVLFSPCVVGKGCE